MRGGFLRGDCDRLKSVEFSGQDPAGASGP